MEQSARIQEVKAACCDGWRHDLPPRLYVVQSARLGVACLVLELCTLLSQLSRLCALTLLLEVRRRLLVAAAHLCCFLLRTF